MAVEVLIRSREPYKAGSIGLHSHADNNNNNANASALGIPLSLLTSPHFTHHALRLSASLDADIFGAAYNCTLNMATSKQHPPFSVLPIIVRCTWLHLNDILPLEDLGITPCFE